MCIGCDRLATYPGGTQPPAQCPFCLIKKEKKKLANEISFRVEKIFSGCIQCVMKRSKHRVKGETFFFFFFLQSTSDGPKRIPVLQQSQVIQKAVVTPTEHLRVLGVSNGPQRVQRPVSHQKPVSNLPFTVKSAHPADQNVNPTAQNVNPSPHLKPICQQNQLKAQAPKVKLESNKTPLESEKLEKPRGGCNTKQAKELMVFLSMFWILKCISFSLSPPPDKPAKNDHAQTSASKYV